MFTEILIFTMSRESFANLEKYRLPDLYGSHTEVWMGFERPEENQVKTYRRPIEDLYLWLP